MSNVLEFVQRLTVTSVECCTCGHLIFMSTDFEQRRRRDKRGWFCTSCGQKQSWQGKSDIDKLREEVTAERERKHRALAEANEQRERAEKAEKARERLKRRTANGVCPCCTRSFTNLKRHMTSKHPDFAPAE